MPRKLDTATLNRAAEHWAGQYGLPSQFSKKNPKVAIGGREWGLQNLFKAAFKDEFEYLLPRYKDYLGKTPLAEFEKIAKERYTPRDDKVFAALLSEHLAIDPDGNHIVGKIGKIKNGSRLVGMQLVEFESLDSIVRRRRLGLPKAREHRELVQKIVPCRWPIYAGEPDERLMSGGGAADPLPDGTTVLRMALNTNVSIAFAIAALNPPLDLLDEGTADGMIEGVSGSQPVDPDAALVGTVLFELDLGTPAFNAAADQAPDAEAAAAAIADDTSAAATGTVTHCRASSSNAFPTPLNDHIDGSAGLTAGTFDFEFNTDAIVINATVSMTAWTFRIPQGPTAT